MDPIFIENYRPISNLCCIEKIIEHYILGHLENFFEDNKIFNINIHGGRKDHSTLSAITDIYHQLFKNKEENLTSVILATDLSAAYDTVDTDVLLLKMNYYGIGQDWQFLFISFLNGRQQFVRLDTKNSILRYSVNCGTIQGSKLSGFLFNIYNNEIPLLYKLINSDIYFKMGGSKLNTKTINHQITNFVDDNSNIISFKNHEDIKSYLENYFLLLIRFYNINKVKLNSDKTKLTIVSKNSMESIFKNFTFRAGNDTIKNCSSIKILGTFIQSDLKLDKSINKLCSELHHRIHNIRRLTPFTDFDTRKKFLRAFVIGKLIYMVPIYSISTQLNIQKLHKIIMTAARAAIGNFCFKKSISYILSKCDWFDISDLIKYSSLNIIHKIQTLKKPQSLVSYFRTSNKDRKVKSVTTKYIPLSVKMNNFYIYKYSKIYNSLDTYIKEKSIKGFKNEINHMMRAGTIPDTMD